MEDVDHIGLLIRKPYFEIMDSLYKQLQLEGYEGANTMYSSFFQFIGNGKKPTELARLANTSKQHVKFLLNNLEEMAYVQKQKDKLDGRAVIYSLTKKGKDRLNRSLEILEEIELNWKELVGEQEIDTLKNILAELGAGIDNEKKTVTNSTKSL